MVTGGLNPVLRSYYKDEHDCFLFRGMCLKKVSLSGSEWGRYKTWLNRLQSYMGPLNFIMVLYLYIIEEPLGVIWQVWTVILTLFLVLVLIIDVIIIYPSEQEYNTRKNPEWNDLRDDIRVIKKAVVGDDMVFVEELMRK